MPPILRYVRERGRGGDGGRDWGSIDWSNIDLSGFGRGGRVTGPSRRAIFIGALIAFLLIIPLLVGPLVSFLTDLLWFRSLGLESVYLRRFTAAFIAFSAFGALFFLLALPNLYFALRPQVPRVVVDSERRRRGATVTTLRWMWLLLIPAFFFGLAGGDEWDMLLRWVNQVPFGKVDPVFGRDIGFYFFTLPVLEFLRGWLLVALFVIAIGVIGLYFTRGVIGVATGPLASADIRVAGRTALALAVPARAHLSILGGLFLALIAAGYVLDQFDLLFREERVLVGAGYTSINARMPALTILTVLVGIAAVACFANAFARTLWVLGGAIVLWFAATLLVGNVYPGLIQNFIVNPDQLNRERPYIVRNIEATRAAYSLDAVDESSFNVADTPTAAEARAALADTTTVRLWDYRPLLPAFDQLQALGQYYTFADVDVDRYPIGGKETPVMLSARELSANRIPQQTWVNRHLVFTHGFGAVATAVGGVAAEGRPAFLVKDIPPQGEPRIDQPRIYYGELTSDYVIVGTSQDEFDGTERGSSATNFSGAGGVGVGSFWDRLLFAIRFGDTNMLVTNQITGQSKVLFHRQILPRQRLIAPFLEYDPDPYLVIANGKLYWINDAFTVGDHYPYSESLTALGTGTRPVAGGRLNYIRNSVKVVTDAYDGTITYYVVDEKDPVIRNLRAIYPALFSKSITDMPQALRDHIRYPEALFSVQAQVFALYHMTDPDDFYNRTDAWRIANEVIVQGGAPQPIEPYYVRTTLPGSNRAEFVLFVPMTPAGGERNNMVGWIAGRADAPDYGKLRVLTFPRGRTIFGPLNVEARIDQDSTIRQQLTLLAGGGGASIIRGNLLVLPVGNSFIYVKPLFVVATQARIPELQRVILATPDRIVMAETFEKALDLLFPAPTQPPPEQPPPPQQPPPQEPPPASVITQLVRDATLHYNQAQDALRRGDFAEYGRLIKLLEDDLAKLRAATGQ
ncbi:MAG TPA: UPF0182 family protein [Candidatus Limnocylindria bacterium]|jgi:hypothetical protein|nr:UPF0182 family protein [Candidatus Limnocylindria bacterium]